MASVDPNYAASLIAYKIGKHLDNADKLPAWVREAPHDVRSDAAKIVVADDMSEKTTQKAFLKAFDSGNSAILRLIYLRDPEGTVAFVMGKLEDTDDKAERDKLFGSIPNEDDARPLLVTQVIKSGDADLMQRMPNGLDSFDDPAEIVELARQNPKFMIETVLPLFKKYPKFPELLCDPDLRKTLAKVAPKQWANLVKSTPQLAVIAGVETAIKKKDLEDNPLGIANEVFDALVNNRGIELGYFTNSGTDTRVILGGGIKDDEAKEQKRKQDSESVGIPFLDIPATQCHQLTTVARTLMRSFPDANLDIKDGSTAGMLLTRSLAAIGTKGLIDSSFAGNVFTDDGAGTATGQVLFTGNESGEQSHSWLIINGVPFDPVLGTKGKQVAAAKANEFKWKVPDRAGEGSGGMWVVKDPTLTVAGNAMGFKTGYRLTKTPEKFLTVDECKQIGRKPVVEKADAI